MTQSKQIKILFCSLTLVSIVSFAFLQFQLDPSVYANKVSFKPSLLFSNFDFVSYKVFLGLLKLTLF